MSSPKVLIIDTYYPKFVSQWFTQHPEVKQQSYAQQLQRLLAEHFGTGDSYSYYLNQQGYQTQDVIADSLCLQQQWGTEHGLRVRVWPHLPLVGQYTDRLPLYRLLQAQIADFQPDILYMQNLSFCDPLLLRKLKKQVKLLVGQIACPLPPTPFVKPFDLILTSFPHFVPKLQALGVKAEYFKIGFEERILTQLKNNAEKKYDVVFIGGFSAVHTAGAKLLEQLAAVVPVDVWGYGTESLSPNSPLRQRYHGEAWAMDMYRTIRQAKICINRHSSASAQYANNMRLYETTGLGTLLVTDQKENLGDLFEVGKEVISYDTVEQLISQVQYYLKHDDEREAIAKAGQERTLREHTYQHRMRELDTILQRYL